MSDQAPKQPIVLDTRENRFDKQVIETVIDKDRAERLQTVAKELGGYTVAVIAESGDPYKTIFETDQHRVVTSTVMVVPEDRVIVSMQNTANPNTPTDIAVLWQNL